MSIFIKNIIKIRPIKDLPIIFAFFVFIIFASNITAQDIVLSHDIPWNSKKMFFRVSDIKIAKSFSKNLSVKPKLSANSKNKKAIASKPNTATAKKSSANSKIAEPSKSGKESAVNENDYDSIPQDLAKDIVIKVVKLPAPPYPSMASAIKASGAVEVKVTIDEEGNVAQAEAISGHPLLKKAAEDAAREAKFEPIKIQNYPVRVSGIIVYNFTR